jgi:hypothetical protein
MLAGAALAVLGLVVFFKGSTLGGVLLLIAGLVVAVMGGAVSGFLSTYDFHEMVVDASKKKKE